LSVISFRATARQAGAIHRGGFSGCAGSDGKEVRQICIEAFCLDAISVAGGIYGVWTPPAISPKITDNQHAREVNKEIKPNTRTTLFPNGKSLLRLVGAILMEISGDRESRRVLFGTEEELIKLHNEIYGKNVALSVAPAACHPFS